MHTAWYRPCTPGQSRVQIEVAGSVLSGQARLRMGQGQANTASTLPVLGMLRKEYRAASLSFSCQCDSLFLHHGDRASHMEAAICASVEGPHCPQHEDKHGLAISGNKKRQQIQSRVAAATSLRSAPCSLSSPTGMSWSSFFTGSAVFRCLSFAGPFQHQTCQPRLSTECRGPHAFLRDLGFKRHEMAHDRAICRFSPGTCDHAN